MALRIASGGKSSTKPAATKGRSTAKRSTAAKSAPKRAPKATATPASGPGSRPRRWTTDDEKVIARHEKKLIEVGEERDRLFEEHKQAVEDVYNATRAAMEAGVPTGVITDATGISRQWLYKMGDHSERAGDGSGNGVPRATGSNGNGGTRRRKPAAKTGSTRKPAATAKRTSTAKKSGPKLKLVR